MYPCQNPQVCGVQSHQDPNNCRAAKPTRAPSAISAAQSVTSPPSAGASRQPEFSQEELDRREKMLLEYMDKSGYHDDFDGKYATPHAVNPSEMSVALLVTENTDSYIGKLKRGEVVIQSLSVDDDDNPQEIEAGGESTDINDLGSITKEDGWVIIDDTDDDDEWGEAPPRPRF